MPKRKQPIVFELNKAQDDLSLIKNPENQMEAEEMEEPEIEQPAPKQPKKAPEPVEEIATEPQEVAPQPEEPQASPKTSADIKTKLDHKRTVQLYLKKFPKKLEEFNELDIENMELTELKTTLADIRYTMNSEDAIDFWHNLLVKGSQATEVVGGYCGFDLKGFGSDIEKDTELKDCVTLMVLENAENGLTEVSPMQKLIFQLGSKATTRYATNVYFSGPNKLQQIKLSEQFIAQYRDL